MRTRHLRGVGTLCLALTALACLLGLLLLFASGCGDGQDAGESALTVDDLREMVLIGSEGLPWELEQMRAREVSNQEAAGEFPDPQEWLRNYGDWGRVSGYSAEFRTKGGGAQAVETEVEYYLPGEGAERAWEAIRGFIVSEGALAYLEQRGLSMLEIDEVDAEKVGEQSTAFRIATGSGSESFETFVVLFRRGSVVASASVGAGEGGTSVADAQKIAGRLDTRIRDVLGR